jgi:DNA repair photolyase
MSKKVISGTAEWASVTKSISTGCQHGCLYCWAKYNACERFKLFPASEWTTERVRLRDVNKSYKKEVGTIFFPTTHDITPAILEVCCTVLEKMLKAGNNVLIVSKPHKVCIERLCRQFAPYKGQILFRFTIGAVDDQILSLWEPGAPTFSERRDCLKIAHDAGFKTSVSCEPLLEPENAKGLYEALIAYITDSIWFGKLNKPEKRVEQSDLKVAADLKRITDWQTDEKVRQVYETLKDKPKVKWKESYKAVLGLPLATEAGQDI